MADERQRKLKLAKAKLKLKQQQEAEEEKGFFERSLESAPEGISRGLDTLGSIGRTAIAGAVDPFVEGDLLREGDVTRAIRGEAPLSDEFMKRAGVGEMGRLSEVVPQAFNETGEEFFQLQRGGPLDVTGRGALGFAMDTATDPTGAIKKLRQALGFGQKALRESGEALEKSALRKVDKDLEKTDTPPLSDVAKENNIRGSLEEMEAQVEALNKSRMDDKARLIEQADNAGVTIDIDKAIAPALVEIRKLKNNQATREIGLQLEKRVKDLRKTKTEFKTTETIRRAVEGAPEGFQPELVTRPKTVTVTSPSKFSLSRSEAAKSFFADNLPENAFTTGPGGVQMLKGPYQKVDNALRKGFRKETIRAGDEAIPGLGSDIAKVNQDLRITINSLGRNAQGPLRREARKEANKPSMSSLDWILLGLGGANPDVVLPGLASKKVGQYLTSAKGRGSVGSKFQGLANMPVVGESIDPLARRAFIESQRDEGRFTVLRNP